MPVTDRTNAIVYHLAWNCWVERFHPKPMATLKAYKNTHWCKTSSLAFWVLDSAKVRYPEFRCTSRVQHDITTVWRVLCTEGPSFVCSTNANWPLVDVHAESLFSWNSSTEKTGIISRWTRYLSASICSCRSDVRSAAKSLRWPIWRDFSP